ncbi:MAG: UbiD family decarboxylase [Nitrososphaerales archaeon]
MAYYKNLGEYLQELDRNEKLFKIDRPVVKETDISSIVRLQFRGLPENQRRGFLFQNVVDSKGRHYDMDVAAGIYGSSVQIYGLALKCEPTREEIACKWQEAQLHPISPKNVNSGPAHEIVCQGESLLEDGKGMESIPVPVEVPGYSGNMRTTTHLISKDPETGIRNMGNYSGHVFGKTKLQWEIARSNHGWLHWNAWKKLGKPMPIAIVVGGPPVLFYVASAKIPYGVDELDIAGGLVGEPIEIVGCRTIDLEVPAQSEIVIEGLVSTEYLEAGNAFGEYTGYMATEVQYRPVIDITCITFRKKPTFVHVLSQFPPSESSKVRAISFDSIFYKFLKYDCKIPGIIEVSWHEPSGADQFCVIKIKKANNAHPWQVLYCAAGFNVMAGKYFMVVDEDIDVRDLDSVLWALCWRVQPARDIKTISGKLPNLDPSAYKPDAAHEEKLFPGGTGASSLLIDATTKWPYPPLALPKKEFMERALRIWKESGLPELSLKQPWYGYSLGFWPKQNEEDAELILKGEHYKVNERLAKDKKKASEV